MSLFIIALFLALLMVMLNGINLMRLYKFKPQQIVLVCVTFAAVIAVICGGIMIYPH